MAGKPLPERLGRYKIVRELGKGAMGIVYEGVDPNIGRRVAIKTARRDVMEATGRADEMMERFLREAKAAGGLSHPNIITIYDAGEEDSMAYIAMEYLEGGDLFDYMEQKKRFTPEEAVEIAATVCEALAVAHDSGIVHRDVKPANILMPTNAALKVADFGIARVSNSNLTQEGAMIGTPHYMSPEQFMGQRADARSDLFSVGIICYEMLTGEKPFAGEALSTVMHNTIKSAPIDPTELNFAINDILSRVVLKSLAKKPQERYADGRAMASAMREALKPHPDPSITLVGGDGGDATVLSQPADIDSTVASVQLPDGTAGPKRPAPKAAPVAQPRQAAGAAKGKPAEEHSALPMIIGGIGILLALIAAAVFVMMSGTSGTPSEAPPPAAAAPEPAPPAAAAPASADFFSEAMITIYFTEDIDAPEAVDTAIDKAVADKAAKPDLTALKDVIELGDATVTLKNSATGVTKRIEVSDGVEVVELGQGWESFTATAESEGCSGESREYMADQSEDVAQVLMVLLKL